MSDEQKPAAWMSLNKERLEFSRADTVYGSHTIPLYTHPNPPVVAQLVEALENAMHDVNWMLNNKQFLNPFVFDYIAAALAAVRGKA